MLRKITTSRHCSTQTPNRVVLTSDLDKRIKTTRAYVSQERIIAPFHEAATALYPEKPAMPPLSLVSAACAAGLPQTSHVAPQSAERVRRGIEAFLVAVQRKVVVGDVCVVLLASVRLAR